MNGVVYDPEIGSVVIDQLVIHGNETRAKQAGYTNPIDWRRKNDPENYDKVVSLLSQIYPGLNRSQHFYGNPAFCMFLNMDSFYRTQDGQIGLTIRKSGLCAFPYDPSVPSEWSHGPVSPPEDPEGYNTAPLYGSFPCPFEVSIALCTKSGSTYKKLKEVTLFEKDANPGRWSYNYAHSASPTTISGVWKNVSEDDRVVIAIIMESTCSCNQGGTVRPVWGIDITAYIPPIDPYVWRRFGKNATEDPDGQRIQNSMGKTNMLDGKWHLVRPIYVRRSNGWISADELKPDED